MKYINTQPQAKFRKEKKWYERRNPTSQKICLHIDVFNIYLKLYLLRGLSFSLE